jgi:hypothetical protein
MSDWFAQLTAIEFLFFYGTICALLLVGVAEIVGYEVTKIIPRCIEGYRNYRNPIAKAQCGRQ